MDTYNILHLSDLHMGKGNEDYNGLVSKIGDVLKGQRVDVVIFTGDIFEEPPVKNNVESKKEENDSANDGSIDDVAKEKLINTAVDFFEKLLACLNREELKLTKENIWFVAGNHDLYEQKENETWCLFDGFLKEFYGDSMPEEYNDKHMIIKVDSDNEKVLLGFSSNIDDKDGKEQFVGHITDEQLRLANMYLEKHPEYQHYEKVAFFHHPCTFFEEREKKDIEGIMNNPLDVLTKLAEWNVRLVLHGHKHWAKQNIYRPAAGQKIYMFAAGTIRNLRDKQSAYIIEMGESICLKEIISINSNKFRIKAIDISDNYMEGLLLKTAENLGSSYNDQEKHILKMIDKLYLSNEPLNLLRYNRNNLFMLENSVNYVLGNKKYRNSSDGITENEWDEVKTILDLEEISKDVRDGLQKNPMKKRYVAFALLGRFFTDFYRNIMRTESVNWNEDDTEFNLGTSCYYLYFNLRRNENGDKARQDLDKIMEEFQSRLYELQDFLYCIKLNIKNIFLELQDNHKHIHHCDFDASVPRLIQLLTGTNIYCHEYSFVRELIQNSIDAISFREKQKTSNKDFDKQILVELGYDEEGKQRFKIRDFGIGMKQEIIEQYFATLGRSYYKEYTSRKDINYNSVSNFGIGFLSVFKPCSKIIIKTKHFLEDKYHKLEINSDRGHYTISSGLKPEFLAGTEIICYFNNQDVDEEEIIAYIKEIMLDIKYDIKICCSREDGQLIKKRKVRNEYHNVIFIPFDEGTKKVKEIKNIDRKNWKGVLSNSMENNRHGILIRAEQKADAGVDILSAGILLKSAGLKDVFGESIEPLQYMKVTMNFPPNWLDIDVSRERVNGICEDYTGQIDSFKKDICSELKRQMQATFKRERYMALGFFKEVSMLVEALEQIEKESKAQNVLDLKMRFEEKEIKFYLNHKQEETELNHLFRKWVIKIVPEYGGNEISERNHGAIRLIYKSLSHDEVSAIRHMFQDQKDFTKSRQVLSDLGLNLEEVDDKYLPLVPAVFLSESQSQEIAEDEKELRQFIEAAVWEHCTVRDVEEKRNCFSIGYDGREQDRIAMESEDIQNRINIIAYHPDINVSFTDKYDFIWNYIIWKVPQEYGFSFKDDKECVRMEVQARYERLKDEIKIIYIKDKQGEKKLIDIYTIASCYMSALMDMPKESLKFQKDTDAAAKYRWIFDVGLGFMYMWILSENGNSDTKRSDMIYNLYNQNKIKDLFEDKERKLIKDRYIQLLASQEKRPFDVLCFAELLRWIDNYIKNEILV